MKNVVTVGGGTGSYTVLSGIKKIKNISLKALVSMADDGGNTGILRSEHGVLPPGDIRQCLVALSKDSEAMLKLMNYRFTKGGLEGYTVGNIILAGLEKVTGDFVKGIQAASKTFRVKGDVIPITKSKARLIMTFSNGTTIEGENKIDTSNLLKRKIENIFYKNNVSISEEAKNAIIKADYIILGPGNLYSSIISNFVVQGFQTAIKKTKAKLILVMNLTNKEGHTNDWSASKYVEVVEKYLGKREVDYIIVNIEEPSLVQKRHYKKEIKGNFMVSDNLEKDPRVIRKKLLSHTIIAVNGSDKVKRSFIRHDSMKLALCIKKIIKK